MKRRKIVISLSKITKSYILHHQKPTFVENVINKGSREKFKALNNVDLKIYQGEKVGIIGANGSGKTTLLKVISGISTPNHGSVKTVGKIVSLISLGAGFHPDLTGEENIFLNGLLIGMSNQEIKQKFHQIVEFAGVGRFIDAYLYTYSVGMTLRLAFAIAVHSEPDILILDEGVMAGDQEFKQKISQKMSDFFKAGKTVILVSHWLEFLKKNCKRIIWLDKGEVKMDGGLNILSDYR